MPGAPVGERGRRTAPDTIEAPPFSGKPSPARSFTFGEKSTFPANHGLTVCWSDEETSTRRPAARARVCAATSVSSSPRIRIASRRGVRSVSEGRPEDERRRHGGPRRHAAPLRRGTPARGARARAPRGTRAARQSGPPRGSPRAAHPRSGTPPRTPRTPRAWPSASSAASTEISPSSHAWTRPRESRRSRRDLRRRRAGERDLQTAPRAGETRHDRPDRDPGHLGDLAVGELLQLPEDHDLPELRRKVVERAREARAVRAADEVLLRRRPPRRPARRPRRARKRRPASGSRAGTSSRRCARWSASSARGSVPRKDGKNRYARRNASWTTSSASCSLRVSQRARL